MTEPKPKKPRKQAVRTPASAIMKAVGAMERILLKLPEADRPRALKMFQALVESPTLFTEK